MVVVVVVGGVSAVVTWNGTECPAHAKKHRRLPMAALVLAVASAVVVCWCLTQQAHALTPR